MSSGTTNLTIAVSDGRGKTTAWQGGPVSTTLSRTDGCQIARWDGLAGLLPVGGL